MDESGSVWSIYHKAEQGAQDFREVKGLAQKAQGVKFEGRIGRWAWMERREEGEKRIDWGAFEFQRNSLDEYRC